MKALYAILAVLIFPGTAIAQSIVWKEVKPREKNEEIVAFERKWSHAGFVSCRVAVSKSRFILLEAKTRTGSKRTIPSFHAFIRPDGRVTMISRAAESFLVLTPIPDTAGRYHRKLVEDRMLILNCLRPAPSEGFKELRGKILSVYGFKES